MITGIDISVCKKIKCPHYSSYKCNNKVMSCGIRADGCPAPKDCEYKNLHVISGGEIVAGNGCLDFCKKLLKE